MTQSAYNKVITQTINPTNTPLTQPIPGKKMVVNADGGAYVFEIGIWKQLERFLIMGTEGGTYYVGEEKLTKDNAQNVIKCIETDGKRAVDMIVQISDSGRAQKNDAALFALALATNSTSLETRKYALSVLPKVARIGTHLFIYVGFVNELRGWSRSLREAVSSWYTDRQIDKLEMQLAKYQSREGWSHKDVLRLAHPTPRSEAQKLAFKWAVGKIGLVENKFNTEQYIADTVMTAKLLPLINAFEEIKATDNEATIIRLIREHQLQMEFIPTEKRSPKVIEAVLPNLGIGALIRQLPTLTKNGIISGAPGDSNTKYVVSRLQNADLLHKGRIHPINVLIALATYKSGHSAKGSSVWDPIRQITDALDDTFYAAFDNVVPTGKRTMLALDLSGSMGMKHESNRVIGARDLMPCEITAAMSMVTARAEQDWMIMGFGNTFRKLNVSPKDRLTTVMGEVVNNNWGSTNCALPMEWAADNKIAIDTFVVYTDNETNTGRHPVQALKSYQQKMGIGAKLISVATSSTNTSIVEDTSMTMNVCGFDANVPNIISDFARN